VTGAKASRWPVKYFAMTFNQSANQDLN
jgi:hypothetical protein